MACILRKNFGYTPAEEGGDKSTSIRDMARSEGMTVYGTFLALKRLAPQILTALRRTGYDLHRSITDMVEMTQANEDAPARH